MYEKLSELYTRSAHSESLENIFDLKLNCPRDVWFVSVENANYFVEQHKFCE